MVGDHHLDLGRTVVGVDLIEHGIQFGHRAQPRTQPVFATEGLGLGRVTRLASGNSVNGYLEPQISVDARGAGQPEFQLFAGFNIQFPAKAKAVATAPAMSDPSASAQRPD
jgi:hypothetical protein